MKILLVDDSKSARYTLRLQLQRHGVEVETADSAESALEILRGRLPDAVLMDHRMPGLNGFEALEILRADDRTAHLPVVLCTAQDDPEFAAAARGKGVAAILPKPEAQERLPDVLARVQALVDQGGAPPTAQTQAPAPGPSNVSLEADVMPLIQGRVDARVDERVEIRLSSLLTPLLDEMRRDLNERLSAATRELIEAERDQVKHLVAHYLRELSSGSGVSEPLSGDPPAAIDGDSRKAPEAARPGATATITEAQRQPHQGANGVPEPVGPSLNSVYLSILGGAVAGALSAAALSILLLR
jgi:CheY-like chemotaxis protein